MLTMSIAEIGRNYHAGTGLLSLWWQVTWDRSSPSSSPSST